MKRIVRGLIEEFLEWEIPSSFPRSIVPEENPKGVRKVNTFVGVRRSGKTWLMYQQMQQLLRQGWKKEQLLYLNFEDDRLASFTSADFQSILDVFFELQPQLIHSTKIAFFFDEIQVISGWENFVRRLIDQEKMQIFVTGSSAKMLSKEIATSLRGRAWSVEVFPCSFSEFAQFKGVATHGRWTPKTSALLRSLATTYLLQGGFPETFFYPPISHNTLLQDYMNTVVFRDVIDRHELKNAHTVKLFFLHCLKQLAAPLSITKVFNTLKSQGVAVAKNSIFDYLAYFEDAYALFTVPLFHFSEKVRQVNPKKLYAVDPGIITAYSIKPQFEGGARLENAVFIELRRGHKEIFYYKTATNREVDFVVLSPNGVQALFQACFDMDHPDTRERELRALEEAAKELKLQEGTVVTQDHEELVDRNGVTIRCIPFWKWAAKGI